MVSYADHLGLIGEYWSKLSPERQMLRLFNAGRHFVPLLAIKTIIMGNLLYLIAVILVIAWAIGYFGYGAGGIIHTLLVIAIIVVLLKFIRREA